MLDSDAISLSFFPPAAVAIVSDSFGPVSTAAGCQWGLGYGQFASFRGPLYLSTRTYAILIYNDKKKTLRRWQNHKCGPQTPMSTVLTTNNDYVPNRCLTLQ